MAIENISINSGTGPKIAVDAVGTDYYQIVKIAQGGDGAMGTLGGPFAVTGSCSIANTPTVTISNNPIVITGTVAGISVTVTAGSFSVVNTPTVTATISGTPIVTATISNAVLGVSGTVTALAAGTQNVAVQGTPTIAGTVAVSSVLATVTVTGTVGALFLQKLDGTNDSIGVFGKQTGSAVYVPFVISTSGGLYIASGGGGGAQYGINNTDMGATGTGTFILGMQTGATTGRALALSATGAAYITGTVGALMLQRLDATNDSMAIYGQQTGSTISIPICVNTTNSLMVFNVNAVGQISNGDTGFGSTGYGFMMIGQQLGATTARAVMVSTTGGLLIASGGGGGAQYAIGSTSQGATGLGTLAMGMQSGSTAAQSILVSTTGGLYIASGGGAGTEYVVGSTSQGATGAGPLVFGMQTGSTAAQPIAVSTTGAVQVQFSGAVTVTASANPLIVSTVSTVLTMPVVTVTASANPLIVSTVSTVLTLPVVTVTASANPLIVSTVSTVLTMPVLSATGVTIASITAQGWNVVGGGVIASGTGTGSIFMGMQSGATLARSILVTTTGSQLITFISTQAVTAANITVASITTGTMSVVNVLSASGITVASLTTGTVSASLMATTANVGAFVGTAHASRWNAFAVNTTSGAGAIVKTSGAHTLYITDLIISVDVPSTVTIYSSAATAMMSLYLATKGGMAIPFNTPLILNSAQSLLFQPSVSGSAMCYAAGYTVT